MKLSELIVAVKEKGLTKTQLEEYRDDLSSIAAQMHMEVAEIEKAEALYLNSSTEEKAVFAQRKWNVTPQGQRQIELKHYIRATDKLLSSVKSRLYSIY